MLLVHDTKPPFLDGRAVLTKQAEMVLPVKDPTSDMAMIARKGSALVKEVRGKRDENKSRDRLLGDEGDEDGKRHGNDAGGGRRGGGERRQTRQAGGGRRRRAVIHDAPLDENGELDYKAGAKFAQHLSEKSVARSEFAKSKTMREQREYLPVFGSRRISCTRFARITWWWWWARRVRKDDADDAVHARGRVQHVRDDRLHAAAPRGGDVGGEARERGDGTRAGEAGGVRHSLRGLHVGGDAHQVHDRRRVAARDPARARPGLLQLRHHGRGARAPSAHGRALWHPQEGGGATTRFPTHRHLRDAGRREVLRLLRVGAHLQHPGSHVPGRHRSTPRRPWRTTSRAR